MAKYGKLHAALHESVIADIKKIIDKNGKVVFYDVEDGHTYIDLAVGGMDGNGCYPDVTEIRKDEKGKYIVSAIDSEYETHDYDLDNYYLELSLGDLCSIHDAMVEFFEGNRQPKFSREV